MFADLDQCIKCTACLAQCPVCLVNPAFDGPKRLGPDLARLAPAVPGYYPADLKLCSNCRNCDIACPHGVNVSRLINLARGTQAQGGSFRLRDRLLANVEMSGKMFNALPFSVKPLLKLSRKVFGLSPNVAFFGGGGHGAADFRTVRQKPAAKAVVYFPGCFASYFEQRVARATIRILNHFGYRVELPRTGCCGLPFLANGFLDAARARAGLNLQALADGSDRAIVTTCPSCGLMLRKEYRELFGLEEAAGVADRVYDLFEFLVREEGVDVSGLQTTGRLAYHAPCHLRATGGGLPAYDLFASLPGVDIVDLDAGCCGQAGSYGFKAENYPTAMAVGESLVRAAGAVRPDRVLTECGTCRIQIALSTGLAVDHPACLLAEMMDLEPA